MKFINKIALTGTLLFTTLQPAFAQTCTYMGEEIPCEDMPTWFWAIWPVFCCVWVVFMGFWIWMLVDAIKNKGENQMVWIIVLLFTGVVGAAVYFFMGRGKSSKVVTDTSTPVVS